MTRALAEVKKKGRILVLLVNGIELAFEGGFLTDKTILDHYHRTTKEDPPGVPGSGRYWTPPLLHMAAELINGYNTGDVQPKENLADAIRKAYPRKKE